MTQAQDDTTRADLEVIFAEAPADHFTAASALNFLETVRGLGKRLHRIYVRQCNGYQRRVGDTWGENTPARERDEADEASLEAQLRAHFAGASLGLYLNTDPRGNPVGILTPKSGRYNTMGGRSVGWRL